jgi:hypothetical protein
MPVSLDKIRAEIPCHRCLPIVQCSTSQAISGTFTIASQIAFEKKAKRSPSSNTHTAHHA